MADELYSVQSDDDYLEHIGKPHAGGTPHSGRYKWGSGEKWDGKDPETARHDLLGQVAQLKASGITNSTEIARALNMTSTEYRARFSVAYNEARNASISKATRLKEQGWSNTAIGRELGVPEPTVRGWLKPGAEAKHDAASIVADQLRATIPKDGAADIGKDMELYFGVSPDKLKVATQMLKDEGYEVKYIYENQLGTKAGQKTTIKVLCAPGVDVKGEKGLYANRDKIVSIAQPSDNAGRHDSLAVKPPVSVKSSRVKVVYADEVWAGAKGVERDGTMMINPNAIDLRLPPGVHYAQVRIAVDGTHYLKGMAVYGDPKKFPKGVDIAFNTNKHKDVKKMDVLKPMEIDQQTGKIDPNNPFKASISLQPSFINPKTGKKQQSPINIVNKEGDWDEWSKSLASQVLSKQSTTLAKRQLDMSLDKSRLDFAAISKLTNPVVKAKLLKEFSDECDSAAVSLKAAAMPGQKTHVILPVNSLKSTEIYAPNYKSGTPVVLVRFPHGGTFEMPALKVNNRNKEGISIIGNNSKDGVGINSKVAEMLSGADFDGDTVLVIPNTRRDVRTSKPLAGLKDFNPSDHYSLPKNIAKNDPRLIKPKTKQTEMGKVSNLITDMTLKGATTQDIERAVKHSMVVIDSEKHKLDYKQSYKDNGIEQLKRKYQGENEKGQPTGASTLISRAKGVVRVDERKPRPMAEGGPINKLTGERVYVPTGATYRKAKKDKNGNIVGYTIAKRLTETTKLGEAKDAYSLSSGTRMESVYAKYSNGMKALANSARKQYVNTPTFKVDLAAKKKYEANVRKMVAEVNKAKMNAPLERKAQLIANQRVRSIKDAHPEYDKDDLKKISNRELKRARTIMGIKRQQVEITDQDWAAIQAHAVSANRLNDILQYADPDRVRELATPREKVKIPAWTIGRAKSLLNQGLTNQEVADALGISVSTLSSNLKG